MLREGSANSFPTNLSPTQARGREKHCLGVRLTVRRDGFPHPQLALTLPSHLKEPDLRVPYEAPPSPALSGIPAGTLALPQARSAAAPEVRARGAPAPAPPHPAPLGLGGWRPRPPATSIVYHPQQKRPERLGAGGRRGERAHRSGPGGRADAELRPSLSPGRVPPLAPPSGLGVRVPETLPSAPAPAHHWPAPAPRAARVPPAPSPHQPSGKLSNSRRSPQLESPGPRRARGARAGPGRTPTGCLAGSGPETPGWAAAFQRSAEERQVGLHDWGGAGGCPRGQTRELRARRLRSQSGAGADCAATPRQVSPPPRSSSVSPGQTSGSEAGALPLLDPAPLSESQNASWISPNWSWTPLSTLTPPLSPPLS